MPSPTREVDLPEEKEDALVWASFNKECRAVLQMAPWPQSTATEVRLTALVEEGVLPAKELVEWRVAGGEEFPTPNMDEIVVHTSFFQRGLSVPVHPFLRGLLYWYGLELHNLNPNGLLHVSCFITLCECFLGIEPHFALWKQLFIVKPQPSKSNPAVVGGAGFQLRPGSVKYYLDLLLQTSNKGWHSDWFYCSNPAPSLPGFQGQPPVVRSSWTEAPQTWEQAGVMVLMARLCAAIEAGVIGVVVVTTFIYRRVQPSKLRAHPMYEYSDDQDATWESAEELSEEEVRRRVGKLMAQGTDLDISGRPPPFSRSNPPSQVSNQFADFVVRDFCFY